MGKNAPGPRSDRGGFPPFRRKMWTIFRAERGSPGGPIKKTLADRTIIWYIVPVSTYKTTKYILREVHGVRPKRRCRAEFAAVTLVCSTV